MTRATLTLHEKEQRTANRVDCPAQNGQGEPLTPPSIRVTYLAVRKEMG
jgi:hypothetical protein